MDSSSLLTAVVLANVAFMVVILVVLLRRVGDAASTTEVTRQLRDQVGETGRLMGELGNQVNAAQLESRAAVAESQAKNLDLASGQYEDAAKRGVKLNDQIGKITGTILDLDEADELSDGTAVASLEAPGA